MNTWSHLVRAAKNVEACEDALLKAQGEFAVAIDLAVKHYGQNVIAKLVGVSDAFISDVRHGNRKVGRKLIMGILLSKPPQEPTA